MAPGVADEVSYQVGIVENIKKDCIEEALRKAIFDKINVPSIVEKIILYETGTSRKDHVFYLKE